MRKNVYLGNESTDVEIHFCNMKKRTINSIFLLIIVIVLAFSVKWIWSEYKMKEYATTCAKCVGFYKSKSYWHYKFEFTVDGTAYVVARKGNDYNKLKQYLESNDCFEIAYSTSDHHCIRIIDKKLGTDSLWFLEEEDD